MLVRSIGTHACMFAHTNTYSNIFRGEVTVKIMWISRAIHWVSVMSAVSLI